MSIYSASPIVVAFARSRARACDDVEEIKHDEVYQPVLEESDHTSKNGKRKLQQVSTQQTRARIVKWMQEDEIEHGKQGLFARTVAQYPSDFCGSVNANLPKQVAGGKTAKKFWVSLTMQKI